MKVHQQKENMMDALKELFEKKMKEKEQNPADEKKLKAKSSVMKEIMKMLDGHMIDDFKNMKKVTVASDSEEGLEEGLDLAKEKVSELSEKPEEELSEESPEMESEEEQSEEERKIAELQKQIEDLKAKKKLV